MTNHELDRLLRNVSPPERDETYWRAFPESVRRQIEAEDRRLLRSERPPSRARSRWAWGLALPVAAAGIVLLAFFVLPAKRSTPSADEQMRALRVYYRQVADLFPKQLEAVVLSADGAQLQLAETPDVPDSPPLFVRVCGPSARCTTAVSFSGRKIRVAGREFEVLANGAGEIFLVAKEGVWARGQAPVGGENWRVEAGWLEGAF